MKILDLESEFKELEDLILSPDTKTFFLAGHLNPDGDTIGSMLAIWSVLKRLHKKSFLFSQDPVPQNLNFLPNTCHISSKLPKRSFDAAILLECSTPSRGGNLDPVLKKCKTVVNIDHHKTSEFYGDINIVETHSSSTAEIVYRLLYNMNVDISRMEATYLYTGIVTDTGRFHFPATSPRTLEVASRLLATGFKFSRINDFIYSTKAKEHLKILGRAMESMEFKSDGKLAVITVTLKDFEDFKASPEHTENVINYGLMPHGVKAAVMFREEPDKVNVTFRSRGILDVSLVAKHFGGGGHKNASGCKIQGKLGDIKKQVVDYICNKLK